MVRSICPSALPHCSVFRAIWREALLATGSLFGLALGDTPKEEEFLSGDLSTHRALSPTNAPASPIRPKNRENLAVTSPTGIKLRRSPAMSPEHTWMDREKTKTFDYSPDNVIPCHHDSLSSTFKTTTSMHERLTQNISWQFKANSWSDVGGVG